VSTQSYICTYILQKHTSPRAFLPWVSREASVWRPRAFTRKEFSTVYCIMGLSRTSFSSVKEVCKACMDSFMLPSSDPASPTFTAVRSAERKVCKFVSAHCTFRQRQLLFICTFNLAASITHRLNVSVHMMPDAPGWKLADVCCSC
jgi:hypothetical protein